MELHAVEEDVIVDRAGVCSARTKHLEVGFSRPSEISSVIEENGSSSMSTITESLRPSLWSRPEPVGDRRDKTPERAFCAIYGGTVR
jgi:hypothetical protein